MPSHNLKANILFSFQKYFVYINMSLELEGIRNNNNKTVHPLIFSKSLLSFPLLPDLILIILIIDMTI